MLKKAIRIGCAGAALACAVPSAGALRAETVLDGDRNAVSLAASNASVEEALKTLGDKFAVRYRSDTPLERRLNGTYSGSLHQLLADVLTGYDYVIVWGSAEQIEVIVLGAAQAKPATVQMTTARTTRRSD